MVKYLESSTAVKHVLRVLKFISWNRPTEFQKLSLFKRSYEQSLSGENEYLHGFVLSLALKEIRKKLSLFKRSYEQNLSGENKYLHGFVLSLALKQIRKWPISFMMKNLGIFFIF